MFDLDLKRIKVEVMVSKEEIDFNLRSAEDLIGIELPLGFDDNIKWYLGLKRDDDFWGLHKISVFDSFWSTTIMRLFYEEDKPSSEEP